MSVTLSCIRFTMIHSSIDRGVGGLVYICVSKLLVKFRIDDAVDAVPVHLGNGAWGIIATGLFSDPALMELAGYKTANFGWFYSWGAGTANANLLLAQFVGLLWIFAWVGTLMTPFFYILLKLNMFRKLSHMIVMYFLSNMLLTQVITRCGRLLSMKYIYFESI